MNKQGILIESTDGLFLSKLLEFIENYNPVQKDSTTITILENGQGEVYRAIELVIHSMIDVRKERINAFKNMMKVNHESSNNQN